MIDELVKVLDSSVRKLKRGFAHTKLRFGAPLNPDAVRGGLEEAFVARGGVDHRRVDDGDGECGGARVLRRAYRERTRTKNYETSRVARQLARLDVRPAHDAARRTRFYGEVGLRSLGGGVVLHGVIPVLLRHWEWWDGYARGGRGLV